MGTLASADGAYKPLHLIHVVNSRHIGISFFNFQRRFCVNVSVLVSGLQGSGPPITIPCEPDIFTLDLEVKLAWLHFESIERRSASLRWAPWARYCK